MTTPQSPTQETPRHDLVAIWQQHTYAEFVLKDADAAVATMTDDAYLLLGPPLTTAVGKASIRELYANLFIPQTPADLQATTISRAVGQDLLIEESLQAFTHDIAMEWMLPGIPPTGRRIELILVVVVGFRDGKIAFERLYWDQASVLMQAGVLDASTPAVSGVESPHRVLELSGVTRP